jgi:hypothetical protein
MLPTVPADIRGSATIKVQTRMGLLFVLFLSVTGELNTVVIMDATARNYDFSNFTFVMSLSPSLSLSLFLPLSVLSAWNNSAFTGRIFI